MTNKFKYSIFITLLYSVITLICVLHHEISTDEVQVWQLCKYLNPVGLINHLHNEGHPSFFYFLIMPFAKLFDNVMFLQFVCWLMSCFSVFLLLRFSPFKLLTNLFIISSAGFLYFFPVIARSYSILPFLIFLAAILHTKRKEHMILYSIVLVMIANTHVIMFGFVSVIFVFLILDIIKQNFGKIKPVYIVSASIIFIGLLLVVLQLYDTGKSNVFIAPTFQNFTYHLIHVVINFISESYYSIIFRTDDNFYLFDCCIILIMLLNFLLMFLNLYLNNKRIFLIAFISIAFQFFVYIIAYPGVMCPQRIFTAYIIIVFCFWILIDSSSVDENKKICSIKVINIVLSVMFLLTTYNGIKFYMADINKNYSSAKQVSEYIINNIDKDNSVILTEHEPISIAVVSYLGNRYKILSVIRGNENEFKYIKWDSKTAVALNALSWLNNTYLYSEKYNDKDIYIMRINIDESDPYNYVFDEYFKLLFKSDASMLPYENYMLYRFQKEKVAENKDKIKS